MRSLNNDTIAMILRSQGVTLTRSTVDLLMQTPSSITTSGPIVTLGPILQFSPILAVGSTITLPTITGPLARQGLFF